MNPMSKRLLTEMCFLIAICAGLVDGVLAAPGHAPTEVAEQLEQLMQQSRVSGAAVARISAGELSWVAVHGERAPGQPVTEDTVFNAASLTKPLFATLVLQQVAQGHIGLDEPLSADWVDPDVAEDPHQLALTARLALSHQTGFVNWRGHEPLRFTFAPGERHEYSGEGYEYLRRALEHRLQRSLPELGQEAVFAPAGMSASHLGWNAALQGRIATGFDERGLPHAQQSFSQFHPNAAAHLFTTITDYGRFAAWVTRGADLPPALWQEMLRAQARHADPAERFSLGWHLLEVSGEVVLWHDGREPGVRSLVVVVPHTRDALVLLTNSDNGELLMRALIADRLPQGDAINQAMDRDVWTYLQRMPREQVSAVARKIAGSPPFLSRLLHAVQTTQITSADLPEDERRAARGAVDAYVQDLLGGDIDPEQATALVSGLLDGDESSTRWKEALDTSESAAWIAALQERSISRTNRVPRLVAPELLQRYVGQYRVPSSKLLISIERHEDSLRASAPGMPPITLLGLTDTVFFMREDDTRFEFVGDDHGTVGYLRLLWRGGRNELALREH